MERAATWPDTPETDLRRDLAQCEAQAALLEKGIETLRERMGRAAGASGPGLHPPSAMADANSGAAAAPPADPDPAAPPRSESEAIAHRISVQEQMRELTAAYAEVLRRHLKL